MKMPFQFYEFFAGAGLVRFGLGRDWRCLWANDIDPRKAEVYAANFGAPGFVLGDVAQLDQADLPQGADMAWASFPCQDLSLAGWRRGMSAERSGTFWAFWRIMQGLFDRGDRPPLIVVENVPGLLYGENIAGLCEAFAALEMQFGALLLDARWFLPQSRARVFIVAVDYRVDVRKFLDPWPYEKPWFPNPIWSAQRSLSQRLGGLWRWWRLPPPPASEASVADLIEDSPTKVEWHDSETTERLIGLMSAQNLAKLEKARANKSRAVGFLYKRTRSDGQRAEIRFDGVAGCLRTPEGGSSRQTLIVVEGGKVQSRLLSPREAARLMGAPDSFKLPGSYNDAYRAMGDGVAVPVITWLSQRLLNPLARLCRRAPAEIRGHSEPLDQRRLTSERRSVEGMAARWEACRK